MKRQSFNLFFPNNSLWKPVFIACRSAGGLKGYVPVIHLISGLSVASPKQSLSKELCVDIYTWFHNAKAGRSSLSVALLNFEESQDDSVCVCACVFVYKCLRAFFSPTVGQAGIAQLPRSRHVAKAPYKATSHGISSVTLVPHCVQCKPNHCVHRVVACLAGDIVQDCLHNCCRGYGSNEWTGKLNAG